MIRVVNRTRGSILATQAELAETPAQRMQGLLGRDGLPEGAGLILDPCNSIHTWFMRFPIDVAFVDRQGTVVRCLSRLSPWRLTWIYLRARRVVELPAGVLEVSLTRPGDVLEFLPAEGSAA